jgi:hypothetical protein
VARVVATLFDQSLVMPTGYSTVEQAVYAIEKRAKPRPAERKFRNA